VLRCCISAIKPYWPGSVVDNRSGSVVDHSGDSSIESFVFHPPFVGQVEPQLCRMSSSILAFYSNVPYTDGAVKLQPPGYSDPHRWAADPSNNRNGQTSDLSLCAVRTYRSSRPASRSDVSPTSTCTIARRPVPSPSPSRRY